MVYRPEDTYDIDLDTCTQEELSKAWMSFADARKYVVEIMGFTEDDLRRGLFNGVIKAQGVQVGRRKDNTWKDVEVQVGGLTMWVAWLLEKRDKLH